jgi:hypothetical protein
MLGRVIFLYSWRDKLPFLVFEIAALLTSRSRRPNSLPMRSAALAIETRSVTSSWSTTAPSPISLAAASPRSKLRDPTSYSDAVRHEFLCNLKSDSLVAPGDQGDAFVLHIVLLLKATPAAQDATVVRTSGYRMRSRSAIREGPVGFQPSFFRVCALEAARSLPANTLNHPK